MSRVVGLILAAGMSRRLGRPKQLLHLEGIPLIAHVVDRALATALDEVIVVTGAQAEQVEAALSGRDVHLVHNPHYEDGQGSSIATGISALAEDVDAAVILLSDQPGISVEVIDRVVNTWRTTGNRIVMTQYGQERGHPVLFDCELFAELAALTGDVGGRDVIHAHRTDLVLVDGGADASPPDVDTEEAWVRLQEAWMSGGSDMASSP